MTNFLKIVSKKRKICSNKVFEVFGPTHSCVRLKERNHKPLALR